MLYRPFMPNISASKARSSASLLDTVIVESWVCGVCTKGMRTDDDAAWNLWTQ